MAYFLSPKPQDGTQVGQLIFFPLFFTLISLGETCCSPPANILLKGLGTGDSEEHEVGGRGQESQQFLPAGHLSLHTPSRSRPSPESSWHACDLQCSETGRGGGDPFYEWED